MKKEYMAPEMEVIMLEAQQLLTVSGELPDAYTNDVEFE